jgi:glutamate synthase domain-containing protein 2
MSYGSISREAHENLQDLDAKVNFNWE